MRSSSGSVLVTGASGYLGGRLAQRFLDAGCDVVAWLHATDASQADARAVELRNQLGARPGTLRFAWGDLAEPQPFSRVDVASIRTIVHAAAVTRFNVDRELAQTVNVDGANKLYQFAEECRSLDAFALLSTLYSAGLREGRIAEKVEPNDDASFANHYEWSKHRTESDLVVRHDALPWSIFRVATAIADGDDGVVVQQNAFHNTLKLLYYGLLSLVPGDEATPLYFVTGDFVVDAIWNVLQGDGRGVFHVCHRREDSLPMKRLVDLAYERFEREADFRNRGILRPLLCDAASFELLGDGVDGFGGPVLNQGLQSVVPFARQLFRPKSFANERLVAAQPTYRAPDPHRIVEDVCDFLVQTRWGKREIHANRR